MDLYRFTFHVKMRNLPEKLQKDRLPQGKNKEDSRDEHVNEDPTQ